LRRVLTSIALPGRCSFTWARHGLREADARLPPRRRRRSVKRAMQSRGYQRETSVNRPAETAVSRRRLPAGATARQDGGRPGQLTGLLNQFRPGGWLASNTGEVERAFCIGSWARSRILPSDALDTKVSCLSIHTCYSAMFTSVDPETRGEAIDPDLAISWHQTQAACGYAQV